MDADLVLIFAFIIVITSLVGVVINGIVKKVLDYKREQRGFGDGKSVDRQVTEIADRTDLIEDRLRVLERIATDKGQLLSDEIEALRRDVPALEHKERG